jgi:glycosyltransferase involved in cell wall biosynthesis
MKKKIILFTISLAKGGAETQLVKLASYLKNRGYTVVILYLLPRNDFKEFLGINAIPYKLISFKKGLGIFGLIKYIQSIQPDVLVSFMFGANVIARGIKFFTTLKLITSVRNNEIANRYFYLYKLTYKLDDISTFNSIVSLEKFKNDGLTVASKSFLMNNAISINQTKHDSSKNDIFTFISIAHFRPQKDYRSLFKAIDILNKNKVPVKLLVLGKIGDAKWPFELIKEYGIEDQVDILGFVNDPSYYIEKSNAVVLSTFWEGTPNAVLEGMSKKKPIVCSDVPGCTELINDSNCGFVSEKSNPIDLANKMEKLMRLSAEERDQLSYNGYKYVIDNHDESKVLIKWEQLICSL